MTIDLMKGGQAAKPFQGMRPEAALAGVIYKLIA